MPMGLHHFDGAVSGLAINDPVFDVGMRLAGNRAQGICDGGGTVVRDGDNSDFHEKAFGMRV